MLKRKAKRFFATLLSLVLVLSMGMTVKAEEPSEANGYLTEDTLEGKYPKDDVYSASWLFGHVNVFTMEGKASFAHLVGPAMCYDTLTVGGGFSNYTNGVSSYLKAKDNAIGDIGNLYDDADIPMPTLYVGIGNEVTVVNGDYRFNGKPVFGGSAIYRTDNYVNWTTASKKLNAESEAIYNSAVSAGARHINTSTPVETLGDATGYVINIGETVILDADLLEAFEQTGNPYYIILNGNFESDKCTVINIPQDTEFSNPQIAIYDPEKGTVAKDSNALSVMYGYWSVNLSHADVDRNGTSVVWNVPYAKNITGVTEGFGHFLAPKADIAGDMGSYNGGIICKSAVLPKTEPHMFPMKGTISVTVPSETPEAIDTDVVLNKLLYQDEVGGTKLEQKAEEFTFTLEGIEGTETEGETYTAKNDANGVAKFSVNHDKAGEYKYTLTEVNLEEDGITYDTTIYNVLIKVTESNGKLVAVVSFTDEDGNDVASDNVVFNNVRATVDDPGDTTEEESTTEEETTEDSGKDTTEDVDEDTDEDEDEADDEDSKSDSDKDGVKTDHSAKTADDSNLLLVFTLVFGAAVCYITLKEVKRRMKNEDK